MTIARGPIAVMSICCILFFGLASAAGQSADLNLQSLFSDIKARTRALMTSEPSSNPNQRVSAPPVLWVVPGTRTEFKECAECPVMVVIPAGEYTMGSPPTEQGGATQHRVAIMAPLAVSKFEITFDEWDACVAGGGCGYYQPDDQGWGQGKQPVINVSWEDAKAYVEWLSRKTGAAYRLLSEAEWEYAARAGSSSQYSFGDRLSPKQANFDASTDGSGPSDENRQRTVPVGTFPANPFGLHDMHGNVAEWVEDCWNDDYTERTPTDGTAWLSGSCNGRVVRGGSWEDSAVEQRSAARTAGDKRDRFYTDGIRVARTL
jgi:formylglycine-generating enzyme required for sulfatase activity